MNLAIMIICLSISLSVAAKDYPEKIDQFFTGDGVSGEFVGLHDPGRIVIKLSNGEVLDTTYAGIDFDTHFDWENESEKNDIKREFILIYTIEEGVVVQDVETKKKFIRSGVMKNHPIDWAIEDCGEMYGPTLGMMGCARLELEAWNARRVVRLNG